MHLNLVVLKTHQLHELAKFYGWLGLTFDYHQHEQGVFHYSTTLGKTVFEIYPLPKKILEADVTTRLGFEISNLNKLVVDLRLKNVKILAEPTETNFEKMTIIEDLDGRKIELVEITVNTEYF